MEEQVNFHFRNKRTIVNVCGEKFSIGPAEQDLCQLQMVSRDDASQITMYVLSFKLKMWAFTRKGSQDMQKRERPNLYTFDLKVKDERHKYINIDQIVIPNITKPNELIDPT